MGLAQKRCVPCRGGVLPFPEMEAQAYLEDLPGWSLAGKAAKIEKTFRFKDFASAMEFARKVGDLSESEGHHPDISFGWGYCTVTFYTHKIHGLHENDFIMAAKVNDLAGEKD